MHKKLFEEVVPHDQTFTDGYAGIFHFRSVRKTLTYAIIIIYRDEKKGLQILLSYSQAGPARNAKHGQEEISRNHIQTFFLGSVVILIA